MTGPLAGGVYLAVLIATAASIGWLLHDLWQQHTRHHTASRTRLHIIHGGQAHVHTRTPPVDWQERHWA